MQREKIWWTVVTDCGTRRTRAVSRAKAIRNVRFRLVMDGRSYGAPRPRDFALMRDIRIFDAMPDDSRRGLRAPAQDGGEAGRSAMAQP